VLIVGAVVDVGHQLGLPINGERERDIEEIEKGVECAGMLPTAGPLDAGLVLLGIEKLGVMPKVFELVAWRIDEDSSWHVSSGIEEVGFDALWLW
jgi:hypothetical protein